MRDLVTQFALLEAGRLPLDSDLLDDIPIIGQSERVDSASIWTPGSGAKRLVDNRVYGELRGFHSRAWDTAVDMVREELE